MQVVCLDVEGVLTPEIWIAFSKATGIEELKLTTRDIPDYDVLMKRRLSILSEHGLKLADIQEVIGTIDPLPGAKEFLDNLRSFTQVVLLSDTFTQFASPLMEKLSWPTLFCNSLEIAEDGSISGYRLRQASGKYHAVKAIKSIGFKVVAGGDSFNDLEMLKEADRGFLFNPPESISRDNPDLPSLYNYSDFLSSIKTALHELQNT